MKWEYSVSTGTIWTSFDYGEVEAETYEEAVKKAKDELKHNFEKANTAFTHCDVTKGFTIECAVDQVEVNLMQEK